MKQKSVDIFFGVLITLVWSLELVAIIFALIFVPPQVSHIPVLNVGVPILLWMFCICIVACWIFNLIVIIRCIVFNKVISITHEDPTTYISDNSSENDE